MSRIPHLLARISQRSAVQSHLAQPQPQLLRPFSATHKYRAESQEHNLSSPSHPQPTSTGGAPTPQTHPTYFPVSARSPPEVASSRNFYRTHGRALFKALTLAFFTYQVLYWAWLSLETEEIRDAKKREIKGLEAEVRLLDEGRKSHGEAMKKVVKGSESGERILEEGRR